MECPVCKSESVIEFFEDLSTCKSCSHIFKSEPVAHNLKNYFELDRYVNISEELNRLKDALQEGDEFEFIFPSVLFYGNELTDKIYDKDINHYFTMTSLTKAVHSVGFKIRKLDVRWDGNLCETFLKVVK